MIIEIKIYLQTCHSLLVGWRWPCRPDSFVWDAAKRVTRYQNWTVPLATHCTICFVGLNINNMHVCWRGNDKEGERRSAYTAVTFRIKRLKKYEFLIHIVAVHSYPPDCRRRSPLAVGDELFPLSLLARVTSPFGFPTLLAVPHLACEQSQPFCTWCVFSSFATNTFIIVPFFVLNKSQDSSFI